MSKIPERQPIHDTFQGAVLRVKDTLLLVSDPPSDGHLLAQGELTVRYGIEYLGKPHLSIVPGLVALDYGDMLTGEEAWDFLLRRSNLHPRADVVGYRNDGEDEMIVVKWLDVMQPVHVLVYERPDDVKPLGRAMALIAPQTDDIPSRLFNHLSHYATLADWQKAIYDE